MSVYEGARTGELEDPLLPRWFVLLGLAAIPAAIGVLIWALVTQTWWALILVPLSGYFFAWISHAFMERNKPATFTHPLWSLISDYRMLWSAITGKLPGELRKAGVTPTGKAEESPAP